MLLERSLPGANLIQRGVDDLAAVRETAEALLVSIGAPRLRRAGVEVHRTLPFPEHRLYALLAARHGDGAHSRYNALIRRLVSLERALECELTTAGRIRDFMRRLGPCARQETRIYFTGGATAVLEGWRESTVDIDIKIVPETDELFRALPALKEELRLNIELTSPDQFIPPIHDWESRSPFIAREGRIEWLHYDPHAQALAKIERGHEQDRADVREMLRRGLVEPGALRRFFEAIRPALIRYPAIHPESFARSVDEALAGAM